MGITYVEGVVSRREGEEPKETVRLLVDSGATYTLLPNDVWRQLGLVAKRRMRFSLADGTPLERDISECYIQLPQGEGHTPVILGEADDQALLGMVTLEALGLVLNPFSRDLQSLHGLLA